MSKMCEVRLDAVKTGATGKLESKCIGPVMNKLEYYVTHFFNENFRQSNYGGFQDDEPLWNEMHDVKVSCSILLVLTCFFLVF